MKKFIHKILRLNEDEPALSTTRNACAVAESEGGYVHRIKALDEQLLYLQQSQQELKHLSVTKNQTFQTISDDVQRPLLRLQSRLQDLLSQDVNEEQYSNEAVALAQMVSEIGLLLENLLQWSKYQAQHKELNLKSCDWAAITKDVVNQMKFVAADKKITLESNTEGCATICADYEMLSLVIKTLLQNIICMMKANSAISLSVDKNNEYHVLFKGQLKSFKIPVNNINIRNYSPDMSENEKSVSLGWMFCRAVIDDHKGNIRIGIAEEGMEVVIGLPEA